MYEFFALTVVLMYVAAMFVVFLVVTTCLLIIDTDFYKNYMRERRERMVNDFLKDIKK